MDVPQERVSSGIGGLDDVLLGGFIPNRAYLIRGGPGVGKTMLGLHFLTAGAARGERTLLITLGEPAATIAANGAIVGFDLAGTEMLDLSPTPEFFTEAQTYDIFSPAEVEREPVTAKIIECVERVRPQRVFVDSLTQLRFLATDAFQFRRQALSFIRYLASQDATVLFASEAGPNTPDDDLQFLADGVINLESGPNGRTIAVAKLRGSGFHAGRHAYRIDGRGVHVYPKLMPGAHHREFSGETIASGVPELDELLHGGVERGTITIITGPTGSGKTTMGLQFMKEAAGRGERSVVYTFEEEPEIILRRCEATGIPARTMIARGTLGVVKIEPLRYSTDEFAELVREEVERQGATIVMLDSVVGYSLSLLQGEDLVTHLHALCKYLQNMGVAVLLINELQTITGAFRPTETGLSYLGDNIIFLRYIERRTRIGVDVRKAVGVLKKRLSSFERTLREYEITRYGLKVGEPIANLSTILRDLPSWTESE